MGKRTQIILIILFVLVAIVVVSSIFAKRQKEKREREERQALRDEKREKEATGYDEEEILAGKNPVGMTAYPKQLIGFVNVRPKASTATIKSGYELFSAIVPSAVLPKNLIATVRFPSKVGKVQKVVKGDDGKNWYKVAYKSEKKAYVRADVVDLRK